MAAWAMSTYLDNWVRYMDLQHEAEQARNRYEVARMNHAAAEVGSIERVQFEGLMKERQNEMQQAENAFSSFKQEVQQTHPEQMKHLEAGRGPNEAKIAEAAEFTANVTPYVVEVADKSGVLHGLNGSGYSLKDIVDMSTRAVRDGPAYVATAVEQYKEKLDEAKNQQSEALNAEIDAHLAQQPPQTMHQERQNDAFDTAVKHDQLAWKLREMEKLEQKHAEERARQEAQLEKFSASQVDKSADIQARQAELVAKARQELAEKQECERQQRQAELERSRAEAQRAWDRLDSYPRIP